jgi:RNA polymerase sigma factor (sigma-70 family)
LDEALEKLALSDRRQAEIVVLRYFGGYTERETAELLEISESLVKQQFAAAKSWLYQEITRG